MIITEMEQEYSNLEWYAIDDCGHIAIFESNAKSIPLSVASSREDLESLDSFFSTIEETSSYRIEPLYFQILLQSYKLSKDKTTVQDLETVLDNSSARSIIRSGIFSYEAKEIINRLNTIYFIGITPNTALNIAQLPANIQSILNRTRVKGCFYDIKTIDVSTIP